MAEGIFQQCLWAAFTAQRPEPEDTALRYGDSGRSEDKLRHFTGTPFYQALLPETQNILRHIRRVEWLRPPQVDALELYIYLKEVRNSPTTQQPYHDLLLGDIGGKSALDLTAEELERLKAAKEQIEVIEETLMGVDYPNAIYSLAMGTGKTALVAAMIFYEFVLSWKHPEDARFAKNTLVFAPDLTIIDSLREIQELDRRRIMPGEYGNFLDANLKFHYLADSGAELTVLPGSTNNVIVSNVQKIILRRYTRPSAARSLFGDTRRAEAELVSNARLQRLQELDNLAVFVDEAHHSFGRSLEGNLKRVRETINHLHTRTPLVGCVNLTGTPYVNNRMLPEVVYHYPLADSIQDGHLKEVRFYDYSRVKTEEFVRDVVRRFWETYGEDRREGLLPKIAVYCATIKGLESEFRPLLEKALVEMGISTEKILVNHSKVDDDAVRRFRELDTPDSPAQFILLVGRGTEGWNCRSLFCTAMYRRPHSRIFLLQSSMRCLRSIGDMPQTAGIFLSTENRNVLEKEIAANLGTTMEALQRQKNKRRIEIRVLKAKKIRLKKPVTRIVQRRRTEIGSLRFGLGEIDLMQYEPVVTVTDGLKMLTRETEQVYRIQRHYTAYALVEETARFTGLTCLEVESILRESDAGLAGVLEYVNRENLLLHEVVIPVIQDALFEYGEESGSTEEELELSPNFPVNRYVTEDQEGLVLEPDGGRDRSYHLDHYIFDSGDERRLFEMLLSHQRVEEVYFTGGITDPAHNEFYVEYYDELAGRWRKYFPDFYLKLADDGWMVIEVKRKDQTEHPNVVAKDAAARQVFETLNGMMYRVKPDDEIRRGEIHDIFGYASGSGGRV
ncbi:MAG: DEAD/DEAH box helicase family protein [Chloroflexota bacterium]